MRLLITIGYDHFIADLSQENLNHFIGAMAAFKPVKKTTSNGRDVYAATDGPSFQFSMIQDDQLKTGIDAENVELTNVTEEKDKFQEWWHESNSKTRELQAEIETLKAAAAEKETAVKDWLADSAVEAAVEAGLMPNDDDDTPDGETVSPPDMEDRVDFGVRTGPRDNDDPGADGDN